MFDPTRHPRRRDGKFTEVDASRREADVQLEETTITTLPLYENRVTETREKYVSVEKHYHPWGEVQSVESASARFLPGKAVEAVVSDPSGNYSFTGKFDPDKAVFQGVRVVDGGEEQPVEVKVPQDDNPLSYLTRVTRHGI